MLIIVDHKISSGAKKKLSRFGELMALRTEGITYPAISGHPDIFFCQSPDHLFVAPNIPEKYFDILDSHQVKYTKGEKPVGSEYPASARYNAVITDKYMIHNIRHTDAVIRDSVPFNRDGVPVACLSILKCIQVEQGYTRCNLLPLRDGHFITSDRGIYRDLKGWSPCDQGLHPAPEGLHPNQQGRSPCVICINPQEINLEGLPHGFFGGCCGVLHDKVFINGSLSHLRDGVPVRDYLQSLNYEIIELSDGPLTDVGSILCV